MAGRAEIAEGLPLLQLDAKLRENLLTLSMANQLVANAGQENAAAIAEDINNLKEFLAKARAFLSNYKGGKQQAALAKSYALYAQQTQATLLASPSLSNADKQQLKTVTDAAQAAWDFYQSGQPCQVATNSGGGNHVRLLPVADCQAFAATIQQQLSTFETVSQQAVVPDDLVITKYLSAEVVFEDDNPCLATPEFYHGLKAGFNVSLTDLWEFAKSIDDAQTYKDLYYAFKLVSCPFPCPEAKVLMGQIELLEGIKAKLKENVGVLPCYEDGLRVGKLFTDILVGEGVAALSSKGIRLIAKASAKVKIKAPLEAAVKQVAKVQGAGRALDDIVLAMKADFPSTWKFNKIGDDAFEVLDGTGKKWGTVTKDKITAPGRTATGTPGNPILNKVPLTKNIKYEVDGFTYDTDDLGRVLETNADLDDIARVRLGNQQIRAVDVKHGVRGTDQGGHIVGSRFFGPGEQINLYPQSANLNQGAWKTMENSWADAMVAGKDVKIKVKAIFKGTSQRPDAFEIEYWIDGVRKKEFFTNQ